MLKVLICISSYGDKNDKYLKQVVDNFRSYNNNKYDITIIVDSTVGTAPLGLDIDEWRVYPPDVGEALAWKHRDAHLDAIDDFDLFVYSENDMLIPERAFDKWVEFDKENGPHYSLGFHRYEIKDNEKVLVDHAWDYPPIFWTYVKIDDVVYPVVRNLHQGCFILSKDQLQLQIDSKNPAFHKTMSYYLFYGPLETAATGPFINRTIAKVVPPDPEEFDDLLILHMPNKYVNGYDDRLMWMTPGEFKEHLTEWLKEQSSR